jgi:hypothetical protein
MNNASIHLNDISSQQGTPENFTVTTSIQIVSSAQNVPSLVARVTFEKGARTKWLEECVPEEVYRA